MNRNSYYLNFSIMILVRHLCSMFSRCRQSRLYFLAHLASVTVRKQFLLHDNKIIRWQSARRARCFSGLLVAPSHWHGAGGQCKICQEQLFSYSPTKPLPCRGLSVTAACARLVVRDCHDLSISVLTPLNPLVRFLYQPTAVLFVWALCASIKASRINCRLPEHSNLKGKKLFIQ